MSDNIGKEIREYDKIVELIKEVSWNQIADIVKIKSGIPIVKYDKDEYFFDVEIIDNTKSTDSFKRGSLRVTSKDNLKSLCGIMANSFSDVRIVNFNWAFTEYEYEGKGIVLWMTIYFECKYTNGGTNGNQICTIWYNFNTGTIEYK